MIYTSGSTGKPKGIIITQGNICHFLRAANEVYGIRAEDVVFQGASLAFDLSMEEIWIPYLVGATLFVADAEIIGRKRQARRCARRDRDHGHRHRADLARHDRQGRAELAPHPSRRRGLARRARGALGKAASAPVQHLRADRGHRGRDRRRGRGRASRSRSGGPIPNYSCWIVAPRSVARPAGQRGRALDRRPRRRARLSAAPGADRAEIHRKPFPFGRLRSDPLPLRRRGEPRCAGRASCFTAASTTR